MIGHQSIRATGALQASMLERLQPRCAWLWRGSQQKRRG
jgi:hypothetical protein